MASTSHTPKSPSTPTHNSPSISPTTKPSNPNPHLSTNPPSSSTTTEPTTTAPPPSPPAPLTITPLTHETLPAYRRLLALLLPIPYQKSFFTEPLHSPSPSPSIALLALWQPSSSAPGTVIGAIQARLCPPEPHPTLYIQTLVLLAPYRHLGVATHLLSALLAQAREREPALRAVWAHVWEASEEALAWYVKRGFVVQGEVVRGYYRRLNPGGARVVSMALGDGNGDGPS